MRKLLLILIAACLFSPFAQASSLTISPSTFDVQEGNPFTFDLDVDLTDPASGGRFLIVFDPNFFQFDSFTFTPDNPWNDDPSSTQQIAEFIPGDGQIDVRLVASFFSTITGPFDIGDFTLLALAPTSSTMVGLDVTGVPDTSQWGAGGVPISIDFIGSTGSVAAIPIPAVAYMFPAGLIAGLGWMRRRGQSIAS